MIKPKTISRNVGRFCFAHPPDRVEIQTIEYDESKDWPSLHGLPGLMSDEWQIITAAFVGQEYRGMQSICAESAEGRSSLQGLRARSPQQVKGGSHCPAALAGYDALRHSVPGNVLTHF